MPLPLIIAGVTAVIGLSAQADAKETNERAQQRMSEAQTLYNTSKHSLEQAQATTENALVTLGTSKKEVLEQLQKALDENIYGHILFLHRCSHLFLRFGIF